MVPFFRPAASCFPLGLQQTAAETSTHQHHGKYQHSSTLLYTLAIAYSYIIHDASIGSMSRNVCSRHLLELAARGLVDSMETVSLT